MFGSACFRCSTLVEDTPLLSCPTKKLQSCSVNKAAAVLQSALTGCRAAAAAAATAAGLIMLVSACHVSSRVTMLSRSRHRGPRVLTASAQCPLCSDSRAVVPRLVRCARRRESVRTAPTFIPPSSRGRGATATPSIRSTTHYRRQQVVLTGTN